MTEMYVVRCEEVKGLEKDMVKDDDFVTEMQKVLKCYQDYVFRFAFKEDVMMKMRQVLQKYENEMKEWDAQGYGRKKHIK